MKIFLQHLPVPAQILTQNLILCNREESFIIKMAIMHDWQKSWAKNLSLQIVIRSIFWWNSNLLEWFEKKHCWWNIQYFCQNLIGQQAKKLVISKIGSWLFHVSPIFWDFYWIIITNFDTYIIICNSNFMKIDCLKNFLWIDHIICLI